MEEFCQLLPKIELHAHLNGSLSSTTLKKLGCDEHDVREYQKLTELVTRTEHTLDDCFKLFQVAHSATNTTEAAYMATMMVIEDFYNDNCVYLELRTTPRKEQDMSPESYVEAVIQAIRDAQDKYPIIVRLILCLDRRFDEFFTCTIMDVILKQHQLNKDIVVGVDLCGNPNEGRFYVNEFTRARLAGLKVTLHCGEVVNEQEQIAMLHFVPDRISHGTCLHSTRGGSEQTFNMSTLKNIPLEVCMTSNVVTGTVANYPEHHVNYWLTKHLPFCICTDDKGVFCSDLSNEFYLIHKHFDLTKLDLFKLSMKTIEYIFAPTSIKLALMAKFKEFKEEHFDL